MSFINRMSPWFVRGTPIAQAADGGITGGNARGVNAVDWQTSRAGATQVASGLRAVIGGGGNNTAAGQDATVAGGVNNSAPGTQSAVSGGQNNSASSQHGWLPGGQSASTRSNLGRGAWAAGAFSVQGDAQSGEFVLRALTTDATATRVTSNQAAAGTTNTANLPNSGTYRLKLLVVAQQTGGTAGTAGDCASWEVEALIKRGASAAATVFVGGRTVNSTPALAAVTAGTNFAPGLADAAATGWRISLAADTTNGGLNLTCTGEANKTIRWVARLMSAEVTA